MEENESLARALIEGHNRRDTGFIEEHVHADAAMVPYEAAGFDDTYTGVGGVRRYFEDAMSWEDIRVEPEGIQAIGTSLVLFWGRLCAKGQASGVELDVQLGWLLEFRGGKVMRLQAYNSPREAFEAVGLPPP